MEKIWLKSYSKSVPAQIVFDEISLPEALARTTRRFPDNPALLFQGTKVSFKNLDDMVSRFASGIRSLGVMPGDKVALLMPNLVQTVVAIFGALRAGEAFAVGVQGVVHLPEQTSNGVGTCRDTQPLQLGADLFQA